MIFICNWNSKGNYSNSLCHPRLLLVLRNPFSSSVVWFAVTGPCQKREWVYWNYVILFWLDGLLNLNSNVCFVLLLFFIPTTLSLKQKHPSWLALSCLLGYWLIDWLIDLCFSVIEGPTSCLNRFIRCLIGKEDNRTKIARIPQLQFISLAHVCQTRNGVTSQFSV